MEYKLNKIDTEIRQKVQDTTKEGFIHRKHEVLINTDDNKEERQQFNKNSKEHSNNKNTKTLSVNAEKVEEVHVEAFIEEKEKKKTLSGRFLDIKR